MIEVVEDLIGSVQDTGTLNGSLGEQDSLAGNLDSVGNVIREQDVNFYDYNGDLLYSYKRNDFLALNEMPSPVAHDKLVSQGWNWDLAEAKAYVERNGCLDIGEIYDVDNKGVIMGVSLKYQDDLNVDVTANPVYEFDDDKIHEVYIDWGDGSPIETITPESAISVTHEYSDIGEYEIRAYPSEDTLIHINFKVTTDLKYIHLGSLYSPDSFHTEFKNLYFLEYVTFPNYLSANMRYDAFENCRSLKQFIASKGFESIPDMYSMCLIRLILSNTIIQLSASPAPFSRICVPTSCRNCSLYNQHSADLYFPNNMSEFYLFSSGYTKGIKCPTIVSSNFELHLSQSFNDYLILPETATVIEPEEGEEEPMIPVTLYDNYIGKTLHIPSWVTNIGKILYLYDYNLTKIYFTEHTQVPILENRSNLTIGSNCYIIVPDALYDEWCTATNWTYFANRNRIKKASEMS